MTLAAKKEYTKADWYMALGIVVIALLAFGAFRLFSDGSKSESVTLGNMQYLAQGYVKGVLKDPSSAQFRNQRGACGEVNSKNSFGGYIGFQRYIAAGKELVILERDSGLSSNQFDALWAKSCA